MRAAVPLKIALAQADDLPDALKLLRAQFSEHAIALPAERVAAGLSAVLASPSLGRVLLAREGPSTIGLAYLAFTWTLERGGLVAWLEELYVLPDRRNAGVGAALLREALAEAARAGCGGVELEVESGHQRVESLYCREAFQPLTRSRWWRPLDPA
jgi:GNAT superfamily N-acetyltransferase